MSKKTKTVLFFVVVCVSGIVAHEAVSHSVQAARAVNPEAQPTILAYLQSAGSLIVGALGGLGAITAFVHKWADADPSNQLKQFAAQAVDTVSLNWYSRRYKACTNEAEKAGLKSAAQALDSQNFASLFPDPPAPPAMPQVTYTVGGSPR